MLLLGVAIAACGSGTKTVTVTEKAPTGGSGGTKEAPTESNSGGGEVDTEGGPVTGYADHVESDSEGVALDGWAANSALTEPAERVIAKIGGKKVAEAVPAIERSDVVEALGKPGLLNSGFELILPMSVLECGSPALGIKVKAEIGGKSGPILFGEGVKASLTEVC